MLSSTKNNRSHTHTHTPVFIEDGCMKVPSFFRVFFCCLNGPVSSIHFEDAFLWEKLQGSRALGSNRNRFDCFAESWVWFWLNVFLVGTIESQFAASYGRYVALVSSSPPGWIRSSMLLSILVGVWWERGCDVTCNAAAPTTNQNRITHQIRVNLCSGNSYGFLSLLLVPFKLRRSLLFLMMIATCWLVDGGGRQPSKRRIKASLLLFPTPKSP